MSTRRALLHRGVRITHRIALVVLVASASAVADGSLSPAFTHPVFSNEVEGALVRAIFDLRDNGLNRALAEIDKVLARTPNFRLAQLVKGDILMARAGRPVAFASNAGLPDVAPLQDEARVRVQRYVNAPPVDAMPAAVLQLAPSQSHALLVDTSRSRLFVYANDHGRPRYVTDFYISLGKYGIDKQREGDQKTPIGVYTIVADREKLPDIYGPRAFPLSYPNDWDRMHGRNGHGIWLHGMPSETYSRPPWATDGCVALTNDDLARLARYVDVSRTPVIIGRSVHWQDPQTWQAGREALLGAFRSWRQDWESRDMDRYFSHYSSRFRSETRDFGAWKARKLHVNAGKTWIKVRVDDVSVFEYPGERDTALVTFRQDYRSNNLSNRSVKRQYWVREGRHWRIVHESVAS